MRRVLGVVGEEATFLAPPFTEEQLALDFAAKHLTDLRFVAPWGQWMLFDGAVWRKDEKRQAFDRARKICREASLGVNQDNRARGLATAKTRAAVVSLASDDQRLAATADQWDRDPLQLNTPAGIVNLRTGTLRPASPEDYSTKLTGASPQGDCPQWRNFIQTVTGGDLELAAYLKRVVGYLLTGLISEHALFFLHGTGANGKSVFLGTIMRVLGDYARTAPMETFTASQSDRHSTELAMLRGARLVSASETEEGRSWAEAKIKALTGGDKIAARFMRQDFFEYSPQFKLLIVGNHKPALRDVNESIRRRFHLVPFEVTIPVKDRDPDLAAKLAEERDGILAWAIAGCQEWLSRGLDPPAAVLRATSEYLEAEDALGAWLEERCAVSPEDQEPSADLFADWSRWAVAAGEYVGRQRAFSERLGARGFRSIKIGKDRKRGFAGLKLKRF